jgi:hypothetical protein
MKRFVFNIVSAASLVLCLASSLLWARSHLLHERYIWRSGSDWQALVNYDGTLLFEKMRGLKIEYETGYQRLGRRTVGFWEAERANSSIRADRRIQFLGAGWYRAGNWFQMQGSHPPPSFWFSYEVYVTSYWLLSLPSSVFPLLWVARFWRRRWRRMHGFCLHCGYNLRASKDRCPECGTPILGRITGRRIWGHKPIPRIAHDR